ncbi:hypothetical protein C5167_049773 [Papaver somniferum]|uniref:Uncharacterized protein n=1 Tax=Papaver somniferum TaxID=3469 RepID=A0A4Y7KLR8_PAPSO|nr:hypothetical protein C5167_049773 [Papaver somniferum]
MRKCFYLELPAIKIYLDLVQKISLKADIMLADKMINGVELVHVKSLLHRVIKPYMR